MTVCMYRDIHILQPYIIDFIQRGCHTLRLSRNHNIQGLLVAHWPHVAIPR